MGMTLADYDICPGGNSQLSATYSYIHIHINLFLHELPSSKTKVNLTIHHSHKGSVTITKIKIYLRLFFQGVVFDLLSAHQIHFQLFY